MVADAQNEAGADPVAADVAPAASASPVPPTKPRKRHRTGLFARLSLLLIIFGLIFAALGLSGKPIPMPVWVVAEVEQRANTALSKALPEAALARRAFDVNHRPTGLRVAPTGAPSLHGGGVGREPGLGRRRRVGGGECQPRAQHQH